MNENLDAEIERVEKILELDDEVIERIGQLARPHIDIFGPFPTREEISKVIPNFNYRDFGQMVGTRHIGNFVANQIHRYNLFQVVHAYESVFSALTAKPR